MAHAMNKYKHGDQPYAFITGSSEGIGRATAVELAFIGFNIILHARTLAELNSAKLEVEATRPGVQVVCLAQDAGEVVEDWDVFLENVKGLNVTVLVNNVGTSCPITSLDRLTDKEIEWCMRVNAIFPTQLTRNLLPSLVQNSPSIILNICSASTYLPFGFLTIYAGSKTYLWAWSQALRSELQVLKRNVECKVVMTGEVSSFNYSVPTSFFIPSSRTYARSFLSRVAFSSGSVYAGYWRHRIQFAVLHFIKAVLPLSVVDGIANGMALKFVTWRDEVKDPASFPLSEIPK